MATTNRLFSLTMVLRSSNSLSRTCFPLYGNHLNTNWNANGARRLSIGRMLDLGGAPSGLLDSTTPGRMNNASKNCRIQAVAFDFQVLTTSFQATKESEGKSVTDNTPVNSKINDDNSGLDHPIRPNVNLVRQVADLLGVDLGTERKKKKSGDDDLSEDDLSRLLTGKKSFIPDKNTDTANNTTITPSSSFPDVRSRYAEKLARKRGMSELDNNKQLQQGDAAGHLAARAHVMATAQNSGNNNQRWMAQSGTGRLLQYLTQRSMKIALLPSPYNNNKIQQREGALQMDDLKQQLSDRVTFDVLLKDGTLDVSVIVNQAADKLQIDHKLIMLVSGRDDYLKAAKDAGMVTCRIRPENSPRGNISAHYIVPSVQEVRTAIDDVNGISFNAVLKGR